MIGDPAFNYPQAIALRGLMQVTRYLGHALRPPLTSVRIIERTEVAVRALLARAMNDESGSTATEYAVIAAVMAIVVVAGARSVGAEIFELYGFVSVNIAEALQGGEAEP